MTTLRLPRPMAISASPTALRWEVRPPLVDRPAGAGADAPGWLGELQAYRGRVLSGWDRTEAAPDADRFDAFCHHLLAREDSGLIGCLRLSRPLDARAREDYLSTFAFEDDPRFPVDQDTAVSGRWMVSPAHRGPVLPMRLLAGGLALARALGYLRVLSVAATSTGQDIVLLRSGARPLPGAASHYSRRYSQAMRLFEHRPFDIPLRFETLVSGMATILAETPAGVDATPLQPDHA